MKNSWERLYLHITKECSTCFKTGEVCGAVDCCEDPLHTIFPFHVGFCNTLGRQLLSVQALPV